MKKTHALTFVFITLLVDVTGLAIIIPVIPALIQKLVPGSDYSLAAIYGGWLMFTFAFMQFLFSPVLGNLSDRFGRRPVLLLSLLGFGLDYIFMAFAPTIFWLFVGRLIAGVTGASFTTASAYIADVSPPEKRSQNFGLIGMAFGLGFILGPAIGGQLGAFDVRAPFLAAAGLSLLNFIYGLFVLPESLPKHERRAFEWKRANPVGSLLNLKRFPIIAGLVVSLLLVYVSAHAVQSTWTYYTGHKFAWDERMVGISLAVVGIVTAIVQGGLIRIIIPWLGKERSVIAGLLLYSLGLVLFSMATHGWMMYAFTVPYCLAGIAGPAIQGIISTQVPAREQGELQGGLMSLISVTNIIGPVMMTSLFFAFSKEDTAVDFPGAPYLMGAILTAVSAFLAWRNFKINPTPPPVEGTTVEESELEPPLVA